MEGFRVGAVDYITKPFQSEELLARVTTHLELSRLTRELKKRAAEQQTLLHLQTILELSQNEIYLFDMETLNFSYANSSALANLSFTMEELREMTPLDLKPEFSAETFSQLIEPLKQRTRNRIKFETIHCRADGSLYPVEAHLQLVETEDIHCFLSLAFDLTEQTPAKTDLHNQ